MVDGRQGQEIVSASIEVDIAICVLKLPLRFVVGTMKSERYFPLKICRPNSSPSKYSHFFSAQNGRIKFSKSIGEVAFRKPRQHEHG